MEDILQSNITLLHESDLLLRVAVRQEAVDKLQADIQRCCDLLECYETLLAAPQQLMKLAADLYRALQGVSHLSPAYYFSLSGFITVIHKTFITDEQPFVSYPTVNEPGGLVPEIANKMVAQVLLHYRPRLFTDHAAALKLLVTLALLQFNHGCSAAERAAFILGLQDIQTTAAHVEPLSQSYRVLPSWIPPDTHPELLRLESVPAFRGLLASLAASPVQWQEYLRFPPSAVVGPVPCRSHSHLSMMQRALLWKTLDPCCLEGLIETLADSHLSPPGQTTAASELHAGNPEALLGFLVKHDGPIILTLPNSGNDKWTSIQPLLLIKQLSYWAAGTQEVTYLVYFVNQ